MRVQRPPHPVTQQRQLHDPHARGVPRSALARAERFVSALKAASAAALLTEEESQGSVPDDLVEACVRHRVRVAYAVPAHILFRSNTDTVYLRQWSELSRHHALPANTRVRRSRLLAQEAGRTPSSPRPSPARAGPPRRLHPGRADGRGHGGRTGRVRAGGVTLVVDGSGVTVCVDAGGVSPYERRLLYLPDPDAAPPRMLHEVAAVPAHGQEAEARRPSAGSRAADDLGALLAVPVGRADGRVQEALRRCGLPEAGPYQVIVADARARPSQEREVPLTEAASREVAGHLVGRPMGEGTPDPPEAHRARLGPAAGPARPVGRAAVPVTAGV
ncbi:hypothetical protein ACQPXS_10615 [Streptomyces sp. CA-142005]|uniref:hypothetical protein n=1 Tax=Streptomyces sp. CA-142005 TaxID=3240052 RepID=UPI003D8B9331